MRWIAFDVWLALCLMHVAGGGSATADDGANELASQTEQVTAIQEAVVVVTRCLNTDDPESDASQAFETLVQGLFSEDEAVSAAAVATLGALVELGPLPYELVAPGGDEEIRIEDPRALALVRACQLSLELMLDSTSHWKSRQSQILQDIPDMRKAGTWIAMADDPASGLLFLQQLARDQDRGVRLWAVHMLWAIGSGIASPDYCQFAQDILQQLVEDDDARVREAAFEALRYPVGFGPEEIFGTFGFTRPYPSGESPFSQKLMQMAGSDDAREQHHGLRLLMYFDRQTPESQALLVGLLDDAAGELEPIDQSLIERSDEYPYLRVGDRQLRAFGIIHRSIDIWRLLDVVSETPEGVAAIRRLRDSLQIDEVLWMRCTIALLADEQLTWLECREDVIDIISDDAQLVLEFSQAARLFLDDDSAGDIIADLDPHTFLLLADEFAEPDNDLVELASWLRATGIQTHTRERAQLPPDELAPNLIQVLGQSLPDEENDDATLYLAALDALTNLNHAAADQAIPVLIEHSHLVRGFTRHPSQVAIIRCLSRVASVDNADVVAALREHLRNGGMSIRTEAAFALARLGIVDDEVLSELQWLEKNGPVHLREQYLALLDSLADEAE